MEHFRWILSIVIPILLIAWITPQPSVALLYYVVCGGLFVFNVAAAFFWYRRKREAEQFMERMGTVE